MRGITKRFILPIVVGCSSIFLIFVWDNFYAISILMIFNFILFIVLLLLFIFNRIGSILENPKLKVSIYTLFILIYPIANAFASKIVNIIIFNSVSYQSDNFIVSKLVLTELYTILFISFLFYALSLLGLAIYMFYGMVILEKKGMKPLSKLKEYFFFFIRVLGCLGLILGYVFSVINISNLVSDENVRKIIILLDFSNEIKPYKAISWQSLLLKDGDVLVYDEVNDEIYINQKEISA